MKKNQKIKFNLFIFDTLAPAACYTAVTSVANEPESNISAKHSDQDIIRVQKDRRRLQRWPRHI